MAGKGLWLKATFMKRCNNCALCREPDVRPHGPYTKIYRRDPLNYESRQEIYIGRQEITDEDLDRINGVYGGEGAPTKEDIVAIITKTATER